MNDDFPIEESKIAYLEQVSALLNMLIVQRQLKKENNFTGLTDNRRNLLEQMGVIEGMAERYGYPDIEELKTEDAINEIAAEDLPIPRPDHAPGRPFAEAAYYKGFEKGRTSEPAQLSKLLQRLKH